MRAYKLIFTVFQFQSSYLENGSAVVLAPKFRAKWAVWDCSKGKGEN